jgi:hypothetical protein
MVVEALQAVGAARSIVIDEDDVVLAGNATLDAAAEAGITKLHVVEADGETIVAVRRRNLTAEQKRALAIYDNRAAELAGWNVEQLRADDAAGLDLQPFWTDAERVRLLGPDAPTEFVRVGADLETAYRCPSCGYEWSGRPKTDGAAAEPAADAAPGSEPTT